MNKHSPTPWTIRPHLPDAHFEVVADANDNTVGTATLSENAALIVEAVNDRDRFVLSVEAETVEAALRWLAAAVRKADGENRYGLSQLLGMAADKLHAIEHAHLNQGNVE